VLHNKPDLVAVAGEHDARFAFGIANAKDIAHDIGTDVVAPRPNPLAHELLHIVLVTGRAWRFDELLEKIFTVGVHDLRNNLASMRCIRQAEKSGYLLPEVQCAVASGGAVWNIPKLSAVGGRFFFVCRALLVFANVALGDGTYQRTKDGKTLVWNNHPQAGDEAKWSGDRDREGYASGFGTLTWYTARE